MLRSPARKNLDYKKEETYQQTNNYLEELKNFETRWLYSTLSRFSKSKSVNVIPEAFWSPQMLYGQSNHSWHCIYSSALSFNAFILVLFIFGSGTHISLAVTIVQHLHPACEWLQSKIVQILLFEKKPIKHSLTVKS